MTARATSNRREQLQMTIRKELDTLSRENRSAVASGTGQAAAAAGGDRSEVEAEGRADDQGPASRFCSRSSA